jgi:hypothetical protein
MEAYLIENEGVLALDSDVFSNVEIVETELTLKQGRKRKDTDGRIDILATYSKEYIGIVELKYGELTQDHLEQLEDYLDQTHQILKQYPDLIDQALAEDPKWIGILVGSSIARDLAHKLTEGYMSRQNVPIAALTINRYRGGDGQVYVVTDTYINSKKSSKDYTQYSFEGKSYGKGRLVLAVVRKYVEDHPEVSYAELMKAFPKELQGSYGVISLKEDADKIHASTQIRRYFTKPDEVIQLKDATIAVSTEWGSRNIEKFLPAAKRHGFKIEPMRNKF